MGSTTLRQQAGWSQSGSKPPHSEASRALPYKTLLGIQCARNNRAGAFSRSLNNQPLTTAPATSTPNDSAPRASILRIQRPPPMPKNSDPSRREFLSTTGKTVVGEALLSVPAAAETHAG